MRTILKVCRKEEIELIASSFNKFGKVTNRCLTEKDGNFYLLLDFEEEETVEIKKEDINDILKIGVILKNSNNNIYVFGGYDIFKKEDELTLKPLTPIGETYNSLSFQEKQDIIIGKDLLYNFKYYKNLKFDNKKGIIRT